MTKLKQRFWSKVVKKDFDLCWPWLACRNKKGYGIFHIAGVGHPASRVAYELCNEVSVLPGIFVCHRCDNPECCNPSHLFLGTNSDNLKDSSSKGRIALGTRNGNSKFNEWQIVGMAARSLQGCSQRRVAKEFGADQNLVWMIANRKIWNHLFQWSVD